MSIILALILGFLLWLVVYHFRRWMGINRRSVYLGNPYGLRIRSTVFSSRTACRCRHCSTTKRIRDMAVCSLKSWGEWTGVCTACYDRHVTEDSAARLLARAEFPDLFTSTK